MLAVCLNVLFYLIHYADIYDYIILFLIIIQKNNKIIIQSEKWTTLIEF